MAKRRVMSRSRPTNRNLNISRIVQRAIIRQSEQKFFDSTVSRSVGSSYTVNALTQDIIQGIGGGSRVGDNIRYKSLNINFRFDNNSSSPVNDVRVVIVLDKFNVGVAPVPSDLFVNTNLTATYSAQQLKSKRFTILFDKMFSLNNAGDSSAVVQKTIMLNQVASYNNVASTTNANGKNSMWLFMVGADNTNQAGMNGDFMVLFTDS